MGKPRTSLIAGAAVAASVWICSISAWAGYNPKGYDLGLVSSQNGLVNTAASIQTNPLWGNSALGSPLTTTFTLPSCQNIGFARLYVDVYGATPYYSAQWNASLNGNALPTLTIGGTGAASPGTPGDGNPATRNPNTTCVYGSGFGYWEIALAGVGPMLNLNGAANTLSITFSNASGSFDGRVYGATLVAVYSDPSINQTLDYQLFEADGYLRQTASTAPPYPQKDLTRSFTIAGVNTSRVVTATYTACYATGHSGQTDQVYFDGNALGPTAGLGNDVARGGFATELHSFNVQPYLQTTDTVSYSIDQSVLGGTGESSMHADVGLLTVIHPSPVQSTWQLATGGSWGLPAYWNNGVPQNSPDTALFGSAIGGTPATVTLDGIAPVVASLTFSNAQGGRYTISPGNVPGQTLTLDNGASAATITVVNNTHYILAPVALAGNTAVSIADSSGGLVLGATVGGTGDLSKAGAGLLILGSYATPVTNTYGNTSVSAGAVQVLNPGALPSGKNLSIGNAAVVQLDDTGFSPGPAGNDKLAVNLGVLNLNDGSSTPFASLDIESNKAVLNKTATAAALTDGIATIQEQIKYAYGSGTWTGTGITSSVARLDYVNHPSSATSAVGWADNSASSMRKTSFGGLTGIDPDNSILIAYTQLGDANLDGSVNITDFGLLRAAFGTTNAYWYQGDFNYDGSVNITDFGKLRAAFGNTVTDYVVASPVAPMGLTSGGGAVPEPGTCTLAAAALVMLAGTRGLDFIGRFRPGRL